MDVESSLQRLKLTSLFFSLKDLRSKGESLIEAGRSILYMAEQIFPVSHQNPPEAASLPKKIQLLLREVRTDEFPIISTGDVLGRVCVSFPSIFCTISLVPGLDVSLAPPRPL